MKIASSKKKISLSLGFFYAGTLIISLTTFRPVASFFNGSDTLYLVSVMLLVIRLLHEGKNLIHVFVRDNPFFNPLLIFLLGATLSLINSSNLTTAVTVMGKYIFLFGVWLPAGIYMLDTPQRIKWMLIVLVIAALVPLIPAVSDYYFQTKITVVIDRLLSLNLEYPIPHEGRFGSVMDHPNNFGLMIVVVFPVSLWLLFFSQTLSVKICGLLFLCLLLIGSLVTASRSTVMAISIQALFFMFFVPRYSLKKRVAGFLFLVMLINIILVVTIKTRPLVIVGRFMEMAAYELGEYEPDAGRIDFMIEAWQAICTHPIAGIGVENTATSLDVIGVHNTILRLWTGIGVWGLVFICWVYFFTFYTAVTNLKKAVNSKSYHNALLSFLLIISFVGWFLVDMVQPQFHNRFKFVTLILIYSLSGIFKTGAKSTIPIDPKLLPLKGPILV